MKVTRKEVLVGLFSLSAFAVSGCYSGDAYREDKQKERDKASNDKSRGGGNNYSRTQSRTPASYVGETQFGNGIDRSELTLD